MGSTADPTTGALTSPEAAIVRAVAACDLPSLRREYEEQGQFVVIPAFLDRPGVAPLLDDVGRLEPTLTRSYIPRHKKSGSVSAFAIAEGAPALRSVYRSPTLRRFLSQLTRADLKHCPGADPHACALYFYTEAGDHMGYHYDTSYYRGARYTVLLGLVQDSSSRLRCRLHTRQPGRSPRELEVPTDAGTLVLFNGDQVHHGVSPSREGERRVVFSMEYVTSQEMGRARRLFSDLKDAFAYFGLRTLWQSRRRHRADADAADA